jgi:ACS family glucarate transporter-like MFS transporter
MSLNGTSTAQPSAPTRVRYAVLALLCVLAMITYMDRAANGSARGAIIADLNASGMYETKLTDADFFLVLIAFQLCYAIFEVPSGWLGDTTGPRATLLRVVLWWSIFVFLTGFAGMTVWGVFVGFTGLIVIQALFGVGEAGAFPNIAKALYNWFPAGDRGFAKSVIWMSARFMGGLTPVVWILLTSPKLGGMGWREAMWLFASLAVVWCVVFALWFRNKPSENPSVNAAELAAIDEGRVESKGPVVVPWGKLLRSRNLWAVCAMYVITNFCWYFLMYNLPGTLRTEFADWNTTIGGELLVALLAGCPLLIGMFGCLLGGTLSDRYIRRTGDRKWGRRLFGMIGYGGAGLCYLAAASVKVVDPGNLLLFAACLIMMGFMNDLIMAPAWAVCQDIGRDYAATVSGAMNMVGNLVGAVSGIFVTGTIMKAHEGNPTTGIVTCLVMYAVVYFLGVGIWLFIDPTKPIAEPDPHA